MPKWWTSRLTVWRTPLRRNGVAERVHGGSDRTPAGCNSSGPHRTGDVWSCAVRSGVSGRGTTTLAHVRLSSKERDNMDAQIVARVFEWRGEIYVAVDRVGRASDRRYAPRHRVATWTATTKAAPTEAEATEYMIVILQQWLADGLPRGLHVPRQRRPGALEGGGGDGRVATGDTPERASTISDGAQVANSAAARRASDGLTPPGVQEALF